MSDRGAFVTEFIYCEECLNVVKSVLLKDEKYLRGILVPKHTPLEGHYPIIAGEVGGLYAGEELNIFENEIIPSLQDSICHPIRIAVIAEKGERIFTVIPKGADEPDDEKEFLLDQISDLRESNRLLIEELQYLTSIGRPDFKKAVESKFNVNGAGDDDAV